MIEKRKKPASGYLLFFLLVLIVTAAAALLFPVYRDNQKKLEELAELNRKLNEMREELTELSGEVSALRNEPGAVEKVAREKFGMVAEGETVIKYKTPEKSTK